MSAEHYRPAPKVLARLASVDFVAVVGPSAAGKTTLIREAARREPDLHPVVNNTSRDPRPDELDGADYRFETRAGMDERIARREYVQVAPNAFGDLYATAAEDYATDGVALLPVLADAVPTFRALPFKSVRVVYVLPPDPLTWHQRLVRRRWSAATHAKRLAEGARSLAFALTDQATLFVVNEVLTTSVEDFATIVLRRSWPARLRRDQTRARTIVEVLLDTRVLAPVQAST
ncbi:MAG: hypothetical protein JXA67_19100 [Micromonosporaceae bacterium]|nr:hypothetical protein [Micromonosporaceae bacterium]